MFSKVLVKLVDQAIIPALLLLLVRIFSVIFISNILRIPYTLGNTGFIFPNHADYVAVNSYSLLTMLLILTLGISYVILKSYIFHDSHITPVLTAKLFTLRMSSLIQTSFDIYSQGIVWLSYVYLMFFVITALCVFGLVFAWIFVVALVLTLFSTVAFVFDIENEMDVNTQPFDEVFSNEEYVLKFGGRGE